MHRHAGRLHIHVSEIQGLRPPVQEASKTTTRSDVQGHGGTFEKKGRCGSQRGPWTLVARCTSMLASGQGQPSRTCARPAARDPPARHKPSMRLARRDGRRRLQARTASFCSRWTALRRHRPGQRWEAGRFDRCRYVDLVHPAEADARRVGPELAPGQRRVKPNQLAAGGRRPSKSCVSSVARRLPWSAQERHVGRRRRASKPTSRQPDAWVTVVGHE